MTELRLYTTKYGINLLTSTEWLLSMQMMIISLLIQNIKFDAFERGQHWTIRLKHDCFYLYLMNQLMKLNFSTIPKIFWYICNHPQIHCDLLHQCLYDHIWNPYIKDLSFRFFREEDISDLLLSSLLHIEGATRDATNICCRLFPVHLDVSVVFLVSFSGR